MRAFVIRAIFWRNFVSYFANPIGYVFITVFVVLGAAAAFLQEDFFRFNLANLDTLNKLFPYLLIFFVPAVTMSAWAEERRHGTDELLLTLPVRDLEVVVGKYLSALGIYTVSLAFSFSHVVVLAVLGNPDLSLMAATYFAYWLMGAALLAVGMLGSGLTSSIPVAFILGAIFTAIFVFLGKVGVVMPGYAERVLAPVGVTQHFDELCSGVIALRAVVYFVALAAAMLYLNLLILARRRWHGTGFVQVLAVVLCVATTAGFLATGVSPKDWKPWIPLSVALVIGLTEIVRGVRWDLRAALGGLRWGLVVASFASVTVMIARGRVRVDATAESLHSLSDQTRQVLERVAPEEPVYIHAYVSPEVPKEWVQRRATLLALLREYEAAGKGRLLVKIVDVEKNTPAAREAKEKFGIDSHATIDRDEGQRKDIYLGLAFVCGARESVVPFLYKGLPVEYELTRGISAVTGQSRMRVGIVMTETQMTGGLNFQTFSQIPEWEIVKELRQQYEVVTISPGDKPPETLDVVIVPMPSTLTQVQMDQFAAFLKSDPPALVPEEKCASGDENCRKKLDGFKREGTRLIVPKGATDGLCAKCTERVKKFERSSWPVLILDDPFPSFNVGLAPWQPKRPPGGMMFGQQRPPEPKGDLHGFLRPLGVQFDSINLVWQRYNPYPDLRYLPHEVVFLGKGAASDSALERASSAVSDAASLVAGAGGEPFNPDATVSSGLQSIVLIGPGSLRPAPGSGITFTPLLRTSRQAGLRSARSFMEEQDEARGSATGIEYVVAARLQGPRVNAIVVADIDLVHDQFYRLRRDQWENKEFDNITFVLNCVDSLAGDESTVALRKRRPRHRTLELIEAEFRRHDQESATAEKNAEERAREREREAQDRFDKKIREIETRPGLDDVEKTQQLIEQRKVEQRRLEKAKEEIKDERTAAIAKSQVDRDEAIRSIKRTVRVLAVLLPPLPAFLIGVLVFAIRMGRERQSIPKERWVKP